jgi:hypothetical protein
MKGLLSGLIALLLTFGGGYWYGKHVEQKAQQAEVDRLNAQARAKEAALLAAVNTTADALRKTNEKVKTASQERDAAITAGTYRMRVPVQTTCSLPATADPSTPAGDNRGEVRAELDPAFGKALFQLTEEGDRAIRRLNACISLYNKAIESQKEMK